MRTGVSRLWSLFLVVVIVGAVVASCSSDDGSATVLTDGSAPEPPSSAIDDVTSTMIEPPATAVVEPEPTPQVAPSTTWDATTTTEESPPPEIEPIATDEGRVEATSINAVAVADNLIAVGTGSRGDDAEIELWALTDGDVAFVSSMPAHAEHVAGLEFASAGNILYSVGEDGWLRSWDVRSGALTLRAEGDAHFAAASSIDVLPGDAFAVTGGRDGRVTLWDTSEPLGDGPVAEWHLPDEVNDVAFVRGGGDGLVVITAVDDDGVYILERDDEPRRLATVEGVAAVTSAADGVVLAGGVDGLWAFDSFGRERDVPGPGPGGEVATLAHWSDGRIDLIVAGGADGSRGAASVWMSDPEAPRVPVGSFGGHVTSVAIAADGRTIVAADREARFVTLTLASWDQD